MAKRESNWSRSNRKSRLPRNWESLRKRIIRRDRVCQWNLEDGTLCGDPEANQVDHIIAGDDHGEQNLQLLCEAHHKLKTSREGYAAMAARKRAALERLRRPEEQHPGEVAAPGAEPVFPWQVRLEAAEDPPPF